MVFVGQIIVESGNQSDVTSSGTAPAEARTGDIRVSLCARVLRVHSHSCALFPAFHFVLRAPLAHTPQLLYYGKLTRRTNHASTTLTPPRGWQECLYERVRIFGVSVYDEVNNFMQMAERSENESDMFVVTNSAYMIHVQLILCVLYFCNHTLVTHMRTHTQKRRAKPVLCMMYRDGACAHTSVRICRYCTHMTRRLTSINSAVFGALTPFRDKRPPAIDNGPICDSQKHTRTTTTTLRAAHNDFGCLVQEFGWRNVRACTPNMLR